MSAGADLYGEIFLISKMPALNIFSFKIGGQAGQGIKSTGQMLSRVATRSGYYVATHTEYPSIIRGGHNVMQVAVSDEKIYGYPRHTDLLVALNRETAILHRDEMSEGGVVIADTNSTLKPEEMAQGVFLANVPLGQLARGAGGGELSDNVVGLGASLGLLGGKLEILLEIIGEEFSDKSEEVKTANRMAAQAGYKYALETYPERLTKRLIFREGAGQIVVNANDAVSLGAVAAGMQFCAIYPMTPTSGILSTLAPWAEKYGFIIKQPEDEIAGINMAIGASFAGARSMVATSGGGFCLMTEGVGLSGMTETPLVIIEGMRGGPSTGLPTWKEQGDLKFILSAGHGEFPRIVLSAGDAEEAFHLTLKAFNLADKYQLPVVVLVDKDLCEDDMGLSPFEYNRYEVQRGELRTERLEGYERYGVTASGISPRAVPGSGNHFISNSDEHDPVGYSSEEAKNRGEQMVKRMAKLSTYAKEDLPPPILFGPEQADLTIVSWGSNKGSIREALKFFPNVNYLHLTRISPFPSEAVAGILGKAKRILDVEANYSGQMAGYIREKTGINIDDCLLKFDGRPIYPEEVAQRIEGILKAQQDGEGVKV